ncbi:hypothetical protein BDW74DRAFT_169926 [Aspergillus multicolor]|uniref:uncharacterized protein n=1 Tax=Aspergillus multicolor TaxID=41759 RepID=UPI003CCE27DF
MLGPCRVSQCTPLLHLYETTSPVNIHTANPVPAGALNISSDDGTQVLKYAEGQHGHVQPDPSGNASLTWEVFLPESSHYNGRYLGVGIGNGGYAGVIDNYTMLQYLNEGYAVGGCDSGHHINENGSGTGYAPYMDDLAKVKAWIHDSIALTTGVARDTITSTYYANFPKHSYYYGCSTGGGQGYSLAQFYPELFDGIYAEGPGNYYTHLILSFLWNQQHTQGAGFLDQHTLDFIAEKVIDACDEVDGVKDRLIGNSLNCDFDIQTLECSPDQRKKNETLCLTSAQVQAVQAIYSGAKDSSAADVVYPGFDFGTESAWLEQQTTLFNSYGSPILRQLVFNNASYNAVKDFNWASDLDAVNQRASPLINGISTNLTAFHRHGGKFITAQGWSDPINAAAWPMQHLEDIKDVIGDETVSEFMRLFMIPGGGHCGANKAYPHVPAKNRILDALVDWVEKGVVPDDGVLSEAPPDGSNVTRRLCPWPKQARFNGGDQGDWRGYECDVV